MRNVLLVICRNALTAFFLVGVLAALAADAAAQDLRLVQAARTAERA